MKARSFVGMLGVLTCTLLYSPGAFAECTGGSQSVTAIAAAKVTIYDAEGNPLREIDKTDIKLPARVINCDEDRGMLWVELADGIAEWIDRDGVTTAKDTRVAQVVCVAQSSTDAADKKTHVTAGIQKASCVNHSAAKSEGAK